MRHSSLRRGIETTATLLAVLCALLAFRCPGPDPQAGPDDGGGGAGDGASGGGGAGQGGGGAGAGGADAGGSGAGGAGGGDPCEFVNLDMDPLNCGLCGRACSLANVDMPICKQGLCDSTCVSAFANIDKPMAPSPDDGCETPGRRAFVTSMPVPANMGGIMQADMLCQQTAVAAELGGFFMAWISDDFIAPGDRFTVAPPAPYILLDGTIVAADFNALITPPLQSPILMDENGFIGFDGMGNPIGFETWTGTDEQGFASGISCLNWSSNLMSDIGMAGLSTNVATGFGTGWSNVFLQECSRTNVHLFCFEQ